MMTCGSSAAKARIGREQTSYFNGEADFCSFCKNFFWRFASFLWRIFNHDTIRKWSLQKNAHTQSIQSLATLNDRVICQLSCEWRSILFSTSFFQIKDLITGIFFLSRYHHSCCYHWLSNKVGSKTYVDVSDDIDVFKQQ